MIQLTKIVLKQTTHHVSAFKHLHGVYMVCTQFFDSYSGFNRYSYQKTELNAIQYLLFIAMRLYPNTTFWLSDI